MIPVVVPNTRIFTFDYDADYHKRQIATNCAKFPHVGTHCRTVNPSGVHILPINLFLRIKQVGDHLYSLAHVLEDSSLFKQEIALP
jgi:hypothetical protein